MSSFLKLEGIDGESGDPKHRGEFDIDDMQFGLSGIFGKNPVPEEFPVLKIQRRVEKDSSKLVAASANGTLCPNGKIALDVEHKGKIITMNNILIRAYSTSDTSGYSAYTVESIELSVEKYRVETPK